ncbi:VanZ family protein [Granulicoccus phenolivorans]|uniref:VanZ family protein n=1 Tax=Granulicoccus phenolivorans TaxID=266854 RepID=UPI0004038A77|nr:VanZ family protein [Granulicoccus phenolivorans]
MSRSRRIAAALGLVSGAAVAFVLLFPDGWAINRFYVSVYLIGLHTFGIPPSVTPEWYAALGNLLLFIPLTACAAIVWPKVRWWIWPVGVLVLSGTFEVVQSFIGREPSLGDVALNTGGALVGAAVVGIRRARRTSEG